jgi:2-oxoglutarate/2-oxoacid ferredoxin oxidoreductase subunit alpha
VLNPEISQKISELDSVVIRFAGDSGDGMQLTGNQFSDTSAAFGNDLATLPDYPAEIRAPIGTVGGVSAYQVHFAAKDIRTPGDELDVLVAMNAAALKKNLIDLKPNGLLFIDESGFDDKNIKLSGYHQNPLETGELSSYRIVRDDFTRLTVNAVKDLGLSTKEARRCKNFFTLGMMFWLYGRDAEHTKSWLRKKFASKPDIANANIAALEAGFNYADTIELFNETYLIRKADLEPGLYRKISGNEATALGFIAATTRMKKDLFFASYPITPASDVLHNLSRYKNFGVKTFQAEDEIAAAASALGSSFAGAIGITSTSGPGLCLKAEVINLAVMTELPLVILNVQRGGPSTGLPTKTEQSDLLLAMFGRNGDSPIVVLAASSPADCFWMAMEACRLAVQFMTPVILLTDGYIGNGTEPWKVPDIHSLSDLDFPFIQPGETFQPYLRNPETMARPWAIPGTPGFEHRVGGLEKEQITGNISYDAMNHQKMTEERRNKINGISRYIPNVELLGSLDDDALVVSWGGTHGSVLTAVETLRSEGLKVAHIHLRYISPLPQNTSEILSSYSKIFIPELNDGQLSLLLNGMFNINAISYNKVQGKPFKVSELTQFIRKNLEI